MLPKAGLLLLWLDVGKKDQEHAHPDGKWMTGGQGGKSIHREPFIPICDGDQDVNDCRILIAAMIGCDIGSA